MAHEHSVTRLLIRCFLLHLQRINYFWHCYEKLSKLTFPEIIWSRFQAGFYIPVLNLSLLYNRAIMITYIIITIYESYIFYKLEGCILFVDNFSKYINFKMKVVCFMLNIHIADATQLAKYVILSVKTILNYHWKNQKCMKCL